MRIPFLFALVYGIAIKSNPLDPDHLDINPEDQVIDDESAELDPDYPGSEPEPMVADHNSIAVEPEYSNELFDDNADYKARCREQVGLLRRVGNTPYYIWHTKERTNFTNFTEAKEICKAHKMEMPKLSNPIGFALLGRALEKVVTNESLKDTWYWIDASYDDTLEMYVWSGNPKDTVKMGEFLYRHPRPTGLGSFITYEGNYDKNSEIPQCLLVSLPWPGRESQQKAKTFYGHQTTLDERPCESRQKRHAICYSNERFCVATSTRPDVLTDTDYNLKYFYDGMWIAGNRSYIFTWKKMGYEDAKKLCHGYNLQLMVPSNREKNLIPYLKLFSREFTVAQFWTGLTYRVDTGKFYDDKGTEVKTSRIKFTDTRSLMKRSNKQDATFCVAASWSYEFVGQSPCTRPDSTACSWSFIDYIPVNCKNPIGAICQHDNFEKRYFEWKDVYSKNLDKALTELSLTNDFAKQGNTDFLRSTFKQQFGVLFCPKGYRMLKKAKCAKLQSSNPLNITTYLYDMNTSYWVVDEQGFKKSEKDLCTICKFTNGNSSLIKDKCSQYNFYICEKLQSYYEPSRLVSNMKPNFTWNEGPQGRIYPVLKAGTSQKEGQCVLEKNVKLQIMFLIDTTNKMAANFETFKNTVRKLLKTYAKRYPGSSFGIATFSNWDRMAVKANPNANSGHTDAENGCYQLGLKLTGNSTAVPDFHLSGVPFLDSDSGAHAVAFTAMDPTVGWASNKMDPTDGKFIKKDYRSNDNHRK